MSIVTEVFAPPLHWYLISILLLWRRLITSISFFNSSDVGSRMLNLHLTVFMFIFDFLPANLSHLLAMISSYCVMYDGLFFRIVGGGSLEGVGDLTSLGTKTLSYTAMTKLIGRSAFILVLSLYSQMGSSVRTADIPVLTSGLYGVSQTSIINDSASFKIVSSTQLSRTSGSTSR